MGTQTKRNPKQKETIKVDDSFPFSKNKIDIWGDDVIGGIKWNIGKNKGPAWIDNHFI